MNKYITGNCDKCYKGKEHGAMRKNNCNNLSWGTRSDKSFCEKEILKL